MSMCLSGSYLNHPACKSLFFLHRIVVLSAACLTLALPYFFPHFSINGTIF